MGGLEASEREPNDGEGFSLCCAEPTCSLCASCGGDFQMETARIANDRAWPEFFGIRGEECSGDPLVQTYSDGVSFCCQEPYDDDHSTDREPVFPDDDGSS